MGKFTIFLLMIFIVASATLVVVVGLAAMEEYSRGMKIQAQITALEEEAQRVAMENEQLQEKIEYFRTLAYKERQAKQKLDYKKPGERAIVVSGLDNTIEQSDSSDGSPNQTQTEPQANYVLWWRLFFPNT
jgi:cell division protein FtsB